MFVSFANFVVQWLDVLLIIFGFILALAATIFLIAIVFIVISAIVEKFI